MKTLRMNRKGISPIFATLILIAISVIAGVVVYMFTSGFLASNTASTNAAQEKVTVQGFAIKTNGQFSVYAQSTNQIDVTVNSVIIKDGSGTTIGIVPLTTGNTLSKTGAISTLTGTLTGTFSGTYTATLTTSSGGSFVSPSAVAK